MATAPMRYKENEPVPYKKAALSSNIVENIENAFAKFEGSKYDAILVAAHRARDLLRGSLPMVTTKSKPCVTALLEMEAGKLTNTYTRQHK
jgi:DNA-directed RNA polymerase omega subunit